MAIGRRIITRSVSATGAATLHQPQPPAHHVPTKPSTSHDKTRITASKKATLLNLPRRRIMKRQSSTDLDETYMHSASSPKRLRSDDVSGEQEQEERSEGMNPEPIPPEPQNAGPSMSNGSTEPSVPTLKRSRGEEEHGSSPRKRQAFDHVPPATPAAQASSSKPPRLPKSRSLPKMPTVFTPARPRSGSDAETITMKRSSLDSVCGDAVLPLEHQGEGGGITPKHPPAAHGEFNPKFTFNPFVVGMQDTKADALPKKPSGDAFGPAVPSLSRLLTVTETPRAPSGTVQDLQVQDEVPLPPSPTKASLPSKPRPSMIPRLVFAPPPAPAPKPAPPKPSPTKFSRFFASPVKPTAPLQRSASALARVPPPPRPSGKALASKRESMLSVEAQASLANLSEALQKLSMPPTRTSIGSSSSEDTLVGTSPRSTNEDDGQEDSTRQANLPPRPSTSLGLHARSGSLATEPGNPRRPAQPGKKPHTGLFPSAPRASVAPTTGSVKAGNDPASKAAPAVDASNDRSKDKGKQRAPLATIGGAPIDIVPTSDCLQGCVIFVDVRTDDGADASSMFIQMLRQLSAKIITRPGKTATHIVWKSGSQATLSRYSSMEQPRPFLVGVGWVVQCVDKKTRVDEKRFLVDLKEAESVFGGMRRRSSLHVKDRTSLTTGLIPTRPLHSRSATVPSMTQTTLTNFRVPKANTTTNLSSKVKGKGPVPASRFVVPPTPVREEVEPPDTEMETAMPDDIPPRPGSPTPESIKGRMAPRAKPPPPLLPLLGPSTAPVKGIATLDTMLDDTRTTLLAEAQETNEQLERARRRSLLFAPKVSSPLKRNFSIFDDACEE